MADMRNDQEHRCLAGSGVLKHLPIQGMQHFAQPDDAEGQGPSTPVLDHALCDEFGRVGGARQTARPIRHKDDGVAVGLTSADTVVGTRAPRGLALDDLHCLR
jgi:hypothetical protein